MVLKNKFNYLIINKMKTTMNFNGMSYEELVAQRNEIDKAINKMRRTQEIKTSFDEFLKKFSATKEEVMEILFGEEITSKTVIEEHKKMEENKIENIWDHPALQAPYTPQVAKKEGITPSPEKTPVEKTEEDLPTMEDLLSDVPEYKALYSPKTPVKKNSRNLPSFEELLSDEPVNQILCLGNEKPKGSPYCQHTRINHTDGIIPTETATGQTMVYISKRPYRAA